MRGRYRKVVLGRGLAGALIFAGISSGCSSSGADEETGFEKDLGHAELGLGGEDSLARAYGVFKAEYELLGEHRTHHVAFGYNPFLSDQLVTMDQVRNIPINGVLTIDYVNGTISGLLKGPRAGTTFASNRFDVWLVRNVVGTARPESGDSWIKIGTFGAPNVNALQFLGPVTLGLGTATGVNFDFDFVVMTPRDNPSPTTNIVASGARTLFEKRYHREKFGGTLDAPIGTRSTAIESKDTLVQRGHFLFFKETFAGNGRVCGTCHREEENLTINKTFIQALPGSDPLFVPVAGLEDPTLLREGVIRENLDGFDNLAAKFVERGVPHTLGMSGTIGAVDTQQSLNNGPPGAGNFPDGPGPDHKTGWSGDGSPGRGTLTEFAIGAVFQHYPTTGSRIKSGAGASFRLPTQEELYALEAFQLFAGPPVNVNTALVTLNDPIAQRGRDLALGGGQCVACHRDIVGNNFVNLEFNTGIENVPIPFKTATNMPKDGGFGLAGGSFDDTGTPGSITAGFGNGQFNVPPLALVADTGPWFHNNAIDGLVEGAVNFYKSSFFATSPGRNFATPDLATSASAVVDVAAFLRTINCLTNIAQVQRRTSFVLANRQPNGSNDPILRAAIEDMTDSINDLSGPVLTGTATTTTAVTLLGQVRQALQTALASADNARAGQLGFASDRLILAKNALRTVGPSGTDF